MTTMTMATPTTPSHMSRTRLRASHQIRGADGGLVLGVICKNPSTPDDWHKNSTFAGVRAWAEADGRFGRIEITNLFGYRAKDNSLLNALGYSEAVANGNDRAIEAMIEVSDVVVAGWGNRSYIESARYERRVAEVEALIGARTVYTVGTLTKCGNPRHPAYHAWMGRPLMKWKTAGIGGCARPA